MLRTVLWGSLGLIAYAHAGYPLVLAAIARGRPPAPVPAPGPAPDVSLIIAAHDEEAVIEAKVANALALEHPHDRLEVIVASDGSTDATVARARAAGAHHVLDLPRGGKVRAQDAAVSHARADLVAFSDANSTWEPDALGRLLTPFTDPGVGYVCGQVRFVNEADGTNQEGVYWRYEMAIRAGESRLAGVTGGNGAIYAVRRAAYVSVDPRMGHDLMFPFTLTKAGWRARYEPSARAEEKMVPSIEGEFRRKRRMMSHAWAIVLEGGLLSPRGYPPLYGFQMFSHRVLRYLTPFLHLAALGAATAQAGRSRAALAVVAGHSAAGLAVVLAPEASGGSLGRVLRLVSYYAQTTASIGLGLWDHLRTGTEAGWQKAEGTR